MEMFIEDRNKIALGSKHRAYLERFAHFVQIGQTQRPLGAAYGHIDNTFELGLHRPTTNSKGSFWTEITLISLFQWERKRTAYPHISPQFRLYQYVGL